MALPHFKKQTNTVTSVNYQTPTWLWKKIDKAYNFCTDPCTFPNNPLNTPLFFTEETNGLDSRKWKGNVYINPPYYQKDLMKWSREAALYALFHQDNVVVMLVPAKTEQFWFQDLLCKNNVKFYFLHDRLKFENTKSSATFSSILVIFNDKVFDTYGSEIIVENVFDKD